MKFNKEKNVTESKAEISLQREEIQNFIRLYYVGQFFLLKIDVSSTSHHDTSIHMHWHASYTPWDMICYTFTHINLASLSYITIRLT